MNYGEIATLSMEELIKRKRDLNQTIFEARMKNALGQLPNPMSIRTARRDIARLNTALRAQVLGVATLEGRPGSQKTAKASGAVKTKKAVSKA